MESIYWRRMDFNPAGMGRKLNSSCARGEVSQEHSSAYTGYQQVGDDYNADIGE